MAEYDELQAQLERLNEQQRQAAETLDGPLLVIAGPGTGKTQLLSVRAANILANRDVAPENILCLTFTEAGSEAMKKRLVELVGRPGYGIEVYTFHAFANRLRNLYPEYFATSASASLATALQRNELINALLNDLHPANPLFGSRLNKVNSNLRGVVRAIDDLKRLGITPDELRAVARQNLASVEWLAQNEVTTEYLAKTPSRAKAEKEAFIRGFEEAVARIDMLAPKELLQRVIVAPGIYEPLLVRLQRTVAQTDLIEGNNTKGYQKVRGDLGKVRDGVFEFRDARDAKRALELANVFEAYRCALAERDLYDYQDMINEAIEALETHPEFIADLQERYRYLQVDEFQDTNGSQMRIVSLLCHGLEHPNVMAVGDDDQAIMRFQGASVVGIRQFRDAYEPTSVVLKTNYRSTPALVELGQNVAARIEHRLVEGEDKAIEAAQRESEQCEFSVRLFNSPSVQYDSIAASIKRRIEEGFVSAARKPEEAIAVIARKHASLRALIPYLNAHGVPFNYRVKAQLTEIESMQTLFALYRAVCALAEGDAKRCEAELPQIIGAPEFGLPASTCVRFAIEARQNRRGWLASLAESKAPSLQALHQNLVEWSAKAPSAPVRELMFEVARPLIRYYQGQSEKDPLALAQFQSGMRRLVQLANEELAAAAQERRALRLPELMAIFSRCSDFNIEIDASVPLGQPGAVTLTTAHSSKGLEYDLVYVLDVDNDSWHDKNPNRNILPKNILTGTEPAEEDITRLLFVAITRAKRLLVLSSAKEIVVNELEGLVEMESEEVDPEQLARVIECDWRDSLALTTPELAGLLAADLSPAHLSASDLNAFVTYEEGCRNSTLYPMRRLLYMPQAPSDALEFGTLVHAFLEDYATHVLAKGEPAAPLVERYLEKVRWLDFPEEDVKLLVWRFERIAATFAPKLTEIMGGNYRIEAKVDALTESGVPLFGKCDVLVIDNDAKTVRVLDYKTGQPKTSLNRSYNRQLDFYTLLLGNSPEFEGYTMLDSRDVFVEPRFRTENELGESKGHITKPEDAAHLYQLIDVVWKRICERRFDTTAFEESEAYRALVAKNPKHFKSDRQKLYEDWLIAEG